jgi:type IV pilus assembly protein PilX
MVSSTHKQPCSRAPQQGVALVVALVLLVVATLIGLAGIRGTTLQEQMSANMYDRSLAFQRAEAALRAAEGAITANAKIDELGGVDCSPESGNFCEVVPSSAFTTSNADWISVDTPYDLNKDLAAGVPQYYIQFMGTGSAESDLGLEANADYGNYGNTYPPDDVAYYRVTARSSTPQQAGDRAIVVLQSTVKRAY